MALPSSQGFGSDLGTDMVSLIVGEEKRKFHVHKKLLCTKVPVFGAMFDGRFKEAGEGMAYLPEDNLVAVELFVEWLYRGFLSPMVCDGEADRHASRAFVRSIVLKWTDVFAFAEKYCIVPLMDESLTLIKAAHQKNHMYYNCATMARGYKSTHENSRLRLYILRSLCYIWMEKDNSDAWPTVEIQKIVGDTPDLLDDLLAATRGRRRGNSQKPHEYPMCDYHQHDPETPCPYQTRNIEVMVADLDCHQSKKRKIVDTPKSEIEI